MRRGFGKWREEFRVLYGAVLKETIAPIEERK
jgi:hypothetical protein